MSSFLLSAKADDLENKILSLEHFDDFEDDNFEDFEDFEMDSLESLYDESFENFRKKGYSSAAANKAALGKVKVVKGTRAAKAVQARKGYKSALINNVTPMGIKGDVRAMLDIVIERNTANIPGSLPVPIFGGIHRESNYQQIVSRYTAARITSVTTTASGNLLLTYAQGVLTDTIEVRCNQVPYATFLEASKFDTFTVFNSRYALANPAQLSQFSEIYASVNKTLFGQAIENQLTVNQFKDPRQFQNGIVDVKAQMSFDKDTALVVGTIDQAVEFTLGLFVNSFASGSRRV